MVEKSGGAEAENPGAITLVESRAQEDRQQCKFQGGEWAMGIQQADQGPESNPRLAAGNTPSSPAANTQGSACQDQGGSITQSYGLTLDSKCLQSRKAEQPKINWSKP